LRPFHGVRATELDLDTLIGRCLSFEPLLLEGQFFSHSTALGLWGAPLPEAIGPDIHVSVRFPRTPPRGAGVAGHSQRHVRSTTAHGLPIATPEFAWCQSAPLLDREDLVAVGDFLVTGPRRRGRRAPGLASIATLDAARREHRRSPGAARLDWALSRVRTGVDSRPETRLRLLLIGSGLHSVVVDQPVPVAGGLTLHADLGFEAERVAIDYEGDGHRTARSQWLRDIERRELMEAAGWRVVRVTSPQLFDDPAALVARICRILLERRAEFRLVRS
jgi:very-short-patch-repair endonuclease